MQNKGFIRVLAVLLTLVCLFYISFSFVTRYYNKKAEEISNGDPVVYKNYLDSMATEKVYLGYYTLKQCNEMEIGLGLDLKGGMNVTLQISVADVLRSLSNNNPDAKFNAALDAATANQADNSDFLAIFTVGAFVLVELHRLNKRIAESKSAAQLATSEQAAQPQE